MNKKMPFIRIIFLIFFGFLLQSCNSRGDWQPRDPLAIDNVSESLPIVARTKGSIYQLGSDTYLYGSERAHRVGDLLTVHIDENLNAQDNTMLDTSRKSELTDKIALTSVVKPGELTVSGENKHSGQGRSQQSNTITGDISVTIIRVLANGNLVVRGYKTLTLSNGVEKMGIAGIVRQVDINSADNSVLSSKIADAHIAYFGRGDLTNSAKKGWFATIFTSPIWPV